MLQMRGKENKSESASHEGVEGGQTNKLAMHT